VLSGLDLVQDERDLETVAEGDQRLFNDYGIWLVSPARPACKAMKPRSLGVATITPDDHPDEPRLELGRKDGSMRRGGTRPQATRRSIAQNFDKSIGCDGVP
jgi:hypothetical protein